MPLPRVKNGCDYPINNGTCGQQVISNGKCNKHMTLIDHVSTNYKLRFQDIRVKEFAQSKNVKSVREEIGMLRLVLETIWNQCTDENDLIMSEHRISNIVSRLEHLVHTCHRIESQSGQLLDRGQLINMGQQIVDIIAKHVSDPYTLQKIASELTDLTLTCITEQK